LQSRDGHQKGQEMTISELLHQQDTLKFKASMQEAFKSSNALIGALGAAYFSDECVPGLDITVQQIMDRAINLSRDIERLI